MELYHFKYLDPVTGKWREARYRATKEDIAATYEQWEVIGEPEFIKPADGFQRFSPFNANQSDGSAMVEDKPTPNREPKNAVSPTLVAA
jgi:hypothetical protein